MPGSGEVEGGGEGVRVKVRVRVRGRLRARVRLRVRVMVRVSYRSVTRTVKVDEVGHGAGRPDARPAQELRVAVIPSHTRDGVLARWVAHTMPAQCRANVSRSYNLSGALYLSVRARRGTRGPSRCHVLRGDQVGAVTDYAMTAKGIFPRKARGVLRRRQLEELARGLVRCRV